jgi:hypothetical protein
MTSLILTLALLTVKSQRESDENSPLRRSGRKRKLNSQYSPDFAAAAGGSISGFDDNDSMEGQGHFTLSHKGGIGDVPKGRESNPKLRRKPLFSSDLPPRHGIGASTASVSSSSPAATIKGFHHSSSSSNPNHSPHSSPLSQRLSSPSSPSLPSSHSLFPLISPFPPLTYVL